MTRPPPPDAVVDAVVDRGPRLRLRDPVGPIRLTARVRAGSVTAVSGPNGSGKSTLLLLLLGVLRPRRGAVQVAGLAPSEFRSARGIGYVPEDPCAPPGWTAEAFLRFGALEAGVGGPAADRAVREVRDLIGVSFTGLIARASRGTRRRLALAFALLGGPPLLLLDEPESALDEIGRNRLGELLPLLRARGTTVVLATHDNRLREEVADETIRLAAPGGTAEWGAPRA